MLQAAAVLVAEFDLDLVAGTCGADADAVDRGLQTANGCSW